MDNRAGRAGSSTRQMAKKRRIVALILLGFMLISLVVFWLLFRNARALAVGGIGTLVLLVLLSILSDIFRQLFDCQAKAYERAVRGAAAEEEIGLLLAGLDETYCVLHDVPSPYGNIDHVVISRDRGIFLLETKSHRGRVHVADGKIFVNGKPAEKDFIAQALRNAYWLRDVLAAVVGAQVWITPIVVFTHALLALYHLFSGAP